MKELCNSCENRGKTNGLSEESYCSSCVHSDSWKVDHFKSSNKKTLISVIGLDGSGKDTVAKLLYELYKSKNYHVEKVYNAMKLKYFVCDFLNIDIDDEYEFFKRNNETIKGKSLRSWMIYFAENLFKPIFGDDFFAKQTLQHIINHSKYGCDTLIIKSDDRYKIEFDSNEPLKSIYQIKYILVIASEEDSMFFNSSTLCTNKVKEKPYLLDLHNFVRNNIENIDLVFNNGSIEDLKLKLENLLQKEF